MLGPLTLTLPLLGAYAIYIDAADRETDSPLGWAILTLGIGYGLNIVMMGLFLVSYLVLHAGERYWEQKRVLS